MSSQKKTFYFVRHGESESNVSRFLVGESSPLTKRGIEQSTFLASRFETIPIDSIVASPYIRTKHTAEIFNKTLAKPIEYSDLIVECRYPSKEYGLHEQDPIRIAIREERRIRREEPGWHHSDEENFEDLRVRGMKSIEYLLSRTDERIAVITHGGFLKVMIACMLFGEKLTAEEYYNFFFFLYPSNTGITICNHDMNNSRGGWQMLSWNDHAHLGEVMSPVGRLSY